MTHPGLASVSDHLFAATLVAYALAMLTFAAEFAFGRRREGRAAAESVAATAESLTTATARVLARVGAGAEAATAATDDRATGDRATAAAAHQPVGHRPPKDNPADRPPRTRLAVAAVVITVAGWLVHLAEVVTRGIAAGRVPWGNMYEFSSAVCLAAIAGFLILIARRQADWLGVFVMVPVVLTMGLAGTVLYQRAEPLQPVLQSYWLKIHVVAAIAASGTFFVGGVTSCLLTLRRRFDNAVAAGRSPRPALGGRLPEAAAIDRLEYRVIAFAFPIWSFAIVAGAIWAESAWGRYWGWDPKETGSFITWLIYAAYLHARATPSARKWSPTLALAGFVALLTNYYVINLLVSGLHSYAH